MALLMLSGDLCIYVIYVFASLCFKEFLEKTYDPVVMDLCTLDVNLYLSYDAMK